MKIGLFPNIAKTAVIEVIESIVSDLKKNDLSFVLSDNILSLEGKFSPNIKQCDFHSTENFGEICDMVISIGGDGTMLNTAYAVRKSSTPILGVNYGKLGFLAEFDFNSLSAFWQDVKQKKYFIEERMTLMGSCENCEESLFAVNDLVIDKGPWPKMIEITIFIDDSYVTTFSADGIVIATPTGSTGYSLSTGGPVVNPKADVITISPIAPHSLTMRPLVISSAQKITVKVNSQSDKIQISSDGQRVNFYNPSTLIDISKNVNPVRLVHSNSSDYYHILRTKLLWGTDIRKSNG